MSVWERLKSVFSTNNSRVVNRVTSSIYGLMPMYGEPPKNSTAGWITAYNLNPRMNPIHQIASDVASAEFGIYSKKSDVKIDNNPIDILLDNPCGDVCISKWILFYITQVYLLLPSGEAFWLKERNNAGYPTQLWPIPPNWVMQIPSKSNPNFLIQPMGNMQASPISVVPEDIIYFKKPNVINPYLRGVGRSEAIGDEIETDEFMAKFQKRFFYNGAIPAAVGQMPNADQPTLERAKETWKQEYQGYNNSHKMAWLGWDAKIQILKETTKEMDFVESRKYLRDTANQHFSIPPEIFGILENSNRSTIDSAYYLYAKNVLRKELKFISDTLNRQLVPDFKIDCYIKYENVVPEDTEFELKKANEGIAKGAITVDEWRLANGLEELENGKGKILYIPNNCVAISLTGKSIPEEISANKPPPPMQISEKPTTDEAQSYQKPKKYKALSNEQKDAMWEVLDKAAIKNEESFIKSLQKFFTGQEKRMLKVIKSVKAPEDKLDWDKENEMLKEIITVEWQKSMKEGFETVNSAYGFGLSLEIMNPQFLEWINSPSAAEKIKGINDTTQKQIQNTIAEAIDQGESIPQIKKRVSSVFEEARGRRATVIARTETHNSVGVGTFTTYKEAGLEKKEWLATSDARTRDSHAQINRQVVDMDKKFANGLMYPGDPNGSAAEVIQCRCTLLPVIED